MYLAIDIGGTKTLLASFTSDGKLKRSVKFKTPVLYDDFRDKLAINVEKLSTKKFTRCAVAIAGKVDRKQGVGVAFGSLTWTNVPIGADVKNIVGCEVLIENDCNVAGLYEAKHVSDKYKRVMYVTISTGIGGAIIQNGHIEKTTQDSEIGHMLFEHDGKLQRWEDFASGGAIVKKYDKLASEIDPKDSGKWYTIARNIAIGLIDVIATLTPEVIIFGGGVGAHFDKYQDRLMEELKIYENPLLTLPKIIQATRPEEAVVYGCYELAKDQDSPEKHFKTRLK